MMDKSICALVHKSGSDRASFQRYYEESHAPLGVQHFPFTGYARNHVLDADGAFDWDTISEFWAVDIGSLTKLLDGPAGAIMNADEVKFMDQSRMAPAGVREVILSAGAKTDEQGLRTALLMSGVRDDSVGERAMLDWAKRYARKIRGVGLDFVSSWGATAFPADVVVWLPGCPRIDSAPPAERMVRLTVRRYETPPETLLGNRDYSFNSLM